MSRHRNVRSMNYSEEYEGFDDVYGHSVEDDHCISPSHAGFLYDRTRVPQMSAFINEDNYIAEEEEQQQNLEKKKSDLNDVEIHKLRSCVDEIENVIGDMVPLSTIEEVVMSCNFDFKIALDQILNEAEMKQKTEVMEETSAQRQRKTGNKDRGGGDGPQGSFHKFVIPKLKLLQVEKVERGVSGLSISQPSDDDGCFSSLKMLMDQHKKEADASNTPIPGKAEELKPVTCIHPNPSTLAEFSKSFLSSRNALDDPPYKVFDNLKMKRGFIIPKFNQGKTPDKVENWVIDLSSALKRDVESRSNESTDDATDAGREDRSPLANVSESDFFGSNTESGEASYNIDVDMGTPCRAALDLYNRKASPFGKILCRKLKRRTLFLSRSATIDESSGLVPFDFSTPSPDDVIMKFIRRK